ncbi:MAG: helix-turn-helix transcriptional regulator [Eubacteriales bacterium]|nr:helix-turn-helix transcriptional regulator [Eubacteriales bacterium]
MNFTERLLKILEEKQITPYKLCKDIGIASNSINNWKKGSLPTIDKFTKIILYLEVDPLYLLGIENNNQYTGKQLSENERELLENFAKLPEREQIKFIGRVEEIAKQFECKGKSSNTKVG